MDHLISLLDVTSLKGNESAEEIETLCQKILSTKPLPAALCIEPQWVKLAKSCLEGSPIKVATVINFPHGEMQESRVIEQLQSVLKMGADEVDLVFPYTQYLSGQKSTALGLVALVRTLMPNKCLKVILETSEFDNADQLRECCSELVALKVDFLKTSTGFSQYGVTPQSADVLLSAAQAYFDVSGHLVGVKCSGGLRTIEQAQDYYNMAQKAFSTENISPKHLRLGASALYDVLQQKASEQ